MGSEPRQDMQPIEGVPRPGEVLASKYRVEKILGIGGMGVVLAARHLQLDEPVALKFLLPDAFKNRELVQRFRREARAAVRIKGEHVARVIDVGDLDSGAPYMVMEYLDGRDLARVLEKRGRLPIAEAIDYVLQACEAIAEAHTLGIVHRDLKPANLFLTRRTDGSVVVKVLDFGISKVAPTKMGSATSEPDMSMTQTSASMGSPLYMSPEQVRSARNVDVRTDVWALGIILFEALTCAQPFLAETVMQVCARILEGAPTLLRELRPEAPPELEAVIGRCLEKDPNARFATVAELAAALAPFGSPHARLSADRVRRVANSQTRTVGSVSDIPPPPSSRQLLLEQTEIAGAGVPAATVASWGETSGTGRVRPGKSTAGTVALAIGVAIAAIAAGAGLALYKSQPNEAIGATQLAPVPASASVAPTEAPAAAGSGAPTVTLSDEPVPTGSRSASATPSGDASSKAPASSAGVPVGGSHPAPAAAPRPKKPDALFDGRK